MNVKGWTFIVVLVLIVVMNNIYDIRKRLIIPSSTTTIILVAIIGSPLLIVTQNYALAQSQSAVSNLSGIEVTQNSTTLNTSNSNLSSNETLFGNSTTAGNQSASSDSEIIISPGSSSPTNTKFYDPPTLTVAKGTTLTWKNADSTLHTVTSGSAESGDSGTIFDSSYMAGGKTFQWTFSSAGTFDYYCTLHPFMKGKVVVN